MRNVLIKSIVFITCRVVVFPISVIVILLPRSYEKFKIVRFAWGGKWVRLPDDDSVFSVDGFRAHIPKVTTNGGWIMTDGFEDWKSHLENEDYEF